MSEPEALVTLTLDVWSGRTQARGWTQAPLLELPKLAPWVTSMVAASVDPAPSVGAYTLTLTLTWPEGDMGSEVSAAAAGALDGDITARQNAVCGQLSPLLGNIMAAVQTDNIP